MARSINLCGPALRCKYSGIAYDLSKELDQWLFSGSRVNSALLKRILTQNFIVKTIAVLVFTPKG